MPLIKALPKENEKIELSSEKTNFVQDLFETYLNSKIMTEGKFGLPNYMRSF